MLLPPFIHDHISCNCNFEIIMCSSITKRQIKHSVDIFFIEPEYLFPKAKSENNNSSIFYPNLLFQSNLT